MDGKFKPTEESNGHIAFSNERKQIGEIAKFGCYTTLKKNFNATMEFK